MLMRTVVALACVLLFLSAGFADEAAPLEVGLAEREITPDVGYQIYRGESTGVANPLMAKAVVLRQGETTAALIIADVISLPRELARRVRADVAEATDIPFEHVGIAATHTHTGPSYHQDALEYLGAEQAGELTDEQRDGYIPRLIEQTAAAAVDAYQNLASAHVDRIRAEAGNVSFNRRFLMRDGSVRFNPGFQNRDIVRPVGPIDPEILTLLFSSKAGEPRGALTNFANHLDTVGGAEFSADYPHYLAETLADEFGEAFISIFGLGAAGDLNHFDVTVPSADRLRTQQIGETLGSAIRHELDDRQPEQPSLAVASRTVFLPMQGYTDEELAWAEAVRNGESAEPLYPERPFLQQMRARKIVSLRDLRERIAIGPAASGEPWMLPVEVQAIRVSDQTAIVTMPGEVFVELGLDLKARSPFAHTLPIELANASLAYIPTRKAFGEGDYEPINSRLAPGGGEAMIDALVELLHELAD